MLWCYIVLLMISWSTERGCWDVDEKVNGIHDMCEDMFACYGEKSDGVFQAAAPTMVEELCMQKELGDPNLAELLYDAFHYYYNARTKADHVPSNRFFCVQAVLKG